MKLRTFLLPVVRSGKFFSSSKPQLACSNPKAVSSSPKKLNKKIAILGQQNKDPLVAVISDLSDHNKEELASRLKNEGYFCMDYTGDDSKLVVGIDMNIFIKNVSSIMEEVLPTPKNVEKVLPTPRNVRPPIGR